MPMSRAKPISVSSVQPLRTIVSGSARKVLLTKPPNVAAAQAATNRTKKDDAERDPRPRRHGHQRLQHSLSRSRERAGVRARPLTG